MNKTREAARLAMAHGKPVSPAWISEAMDVTNSEASNIANRWINSKLYECEKMVINDQYHWLVTWVSEKTNNQESIEHLLPEIQRMRSQGLSVNVMSDKLGITSGKLYRFMRNQGMVTGHGPLSQVSRRKKKYISNGIIDEFKSNPETRLWSIALGFNV